MKQQYESEILFHLMERDGFNIPSSVPPYEAEIKAYLINQVKQAYPKLNDYEAEWLLYNYTKHLPAEFPISSVSNVTEASFENVVPFAYQSAILKGNTEVVAGKNKCNMEKIEIGWLDGNTGVVNTDDEGVFLPVEVSGTITISNYIHTDIRYVYEYDANGKYLGRTKVTADNATLDLTQNTTLIKIAFYRGTLSTVKTLQLQVEQGEIATEYEPYNQTLVSVKMPVLTTTGKNLFKGWVSGEINESTGMLTPSSTVVSSDFIKIPSYGTYISSNNSVSRNVNVFLYDENKHFITRAATAVSFISISTGSYIRLSMGNSNNDKYQFEKGSTITPYEPYKSNILTTSEDVLLRGIGEVKDELDVLTGELTQRIGEVILNENLKITQYGGQTGGNTVAFRFSNLPINPEWTGGGIKPFLLNNIFPTATYNQVLGSSFEDKEGICLDTSNEDLTNAIVVRILKSRLISENVEGIKDFVSKNRITIVCKVAHPTVKTVDLKTVNESGESIYFMPLEGTMHIHSDGTPLKPTITMEIPVEATTQNLASFIDLEAEE